MMWMWWWWWVVLVVLGAVLVHYWRWKDMDPAKLTKERFSYDVAAAERKLGEHTTRTT